MLYDKFNGIDIRIDSENAIFFTFNNYTFKRSLKDPSIVPDCPVVHYTACEGKDTIQKQQLNPKRFRDKKNLCYNKI